MEQHILNQGPWSKEEDIYIRAHYHEDGALAVAKTIRRSCGSVRKRAHYLKISRHRAQKSWSREEDAQLKKLRKTRTSREIALILGRTRASVLSHVSEIGLSTPPREPWTTRELETVRKYYPNTSMRKLSHMLGRSPSAVHKMVARAGIKKNVR